VTVGITTFRRPQLLGALLDVVGQRIREASEWIEASVLIVDNDPAESARPVAIVNSGVRYVPEHRPGIAAARQRALDETPDGELLLFLDDDVIPSEQWLEPLIATQAKSSAAVVAGHVRYIYPDGTDPWVVKGGFMRRASQPTGTQLVAAAGGNLLVDVTVVRRLGVRFDPSLGLSGGEDTLFTRQLARAGASIVSCQESVVDGHVPVERTTRGFSRARARGHGSASLLVALRLAGPSPVARFVVRLRCLIGGLLRVALGYAKHLTGRLRSDFGGDANGIRIADRGWGMACASLGLTLAEYRRTEAAAEAAAP
jgi:GT2 family glycosyltransferase